MGSDARTIAVIGGNGGMGTLLTRMLRGQGHNVLIADVATELRPEDAARQSDVTIISVPIDRTVEVIRGVAPHVPDHALLMDVCSLKSEPVAAMLESGGSFVIGSHPMFGPATASLRGQVVVLTPGRGGDWSDWVRRVWEHEGASVIEATPEEHDRIMSVIQVLRHFATIVFGRTLTNLGIDLDRSLEFSSPIYRLELMMTSRLFAQDPGLYADIEMLNPNREQVIDAFLNAAEEMSTLVKEGDRAGFMTSFAAIAEFFGSFRDEALVASERALTALRTPES